MAEAAEPLYHNPQSGEEAQEWRGASQDIAAEVLVLDDIGKHLLDVGCINTKRFLLQIRTFERNLIKKLFHDGVKAPRANVFGSVINSSSKAGYLPHSIIVKRQLD